MPLPARLIALLVAATLALVGCSGDDEPSADAPTTSDGSQSATASETVEPYLDVPDGVELTAPGSTLEVGDTATVAYQLPKNRGVGALDITVTSLEKASFDLFTGWELTKETKQTSPYFVRAKLENVGDTNLGGRPVPLYIVDGQNRLIESSVFTGTFKPCEGASFPKKFKPGDSVKACMVYLSPDKGELTAVSFRPSQDFNPITWTGELQPAKGTGSGKGKKDKNKKKQNGGNGG